MCHVSCAQESQEFWSALGFQPLILPRVCGKTILFISFSFQRWGKSYFGRCTVGLWLSRYNQLQNKTFRFWPLVVKKTNFNTTKEKPTDLQEHPFDDHDLLPGVDTECGELSVVGEGPHRSDEILALLWGLLRLAREKQAARGHHLCMCNASNGYGYCLVFSKYFRQLFRMWLNWRLLALSIYVSFEL